MTDELSAPPSRGPLQGLRLVDLTSVILGSFATQMLGDLGAEVVKIEAPATPQQTLPGDIMRWAGPAPVAGMGPLFLGFNRNKRSLALDLQQAQARQQLYTLIASADVFVSSLRMSSLQKLGLSFAHLQEIRPGLIYAHACGFGSDGPYAGLPAYDDLIQAASGGSDLLPRCAANVAASAQADTPAQTPQAPSYLPGLLADKSVGLYLAQAILAALYHRQQEQAEGRKAAAQFIEVPMLECYTHFTFSENLYGHSYRPSLADYGYPRVLNPYRKPYRSRDGYLAVLPYSDRQWRDFFHAAGCAGLFDQRFQEYPERSRNIAALYALMEQIIPGRSNAEWIALLRPLDIPVMPAYRLDQVQEDPHLQAVSLFQTQQHPQLGEYVSLRHPVRYTTHPHLPQGHPPQLGEAHIEDFLDNL